MASYGTVMIGTLAAGVTADDWMRAVKQWASERNVEGYQGQYTLVGDDGRSIVDCVIFETKELYQRLANDPAQDAWWKANAQPLLDGEPRWIDGVWPDDPS